MIECPESEDQVMCCLTTLPDPETGEARVICSGPAVKKTDEGKELCRRPVIDSCDYDPRRLIEE